MYLIAKVPEDISKKLDEVIQAKDNVQREHLNAWVKKNYKGV